MSLQSLDFLITFFHFALLCNFSLLCSAKLCLTLIFLITHNECQTFLLSYFSPSFLISKSHPPHLLFLSFLESVRGGTWAFGSRGERPLHLIFQHSPFVLSQTNKDHWWSTSTTPRHSLRCTKFSMPTGFVKMSSSYYLDLQNSILISPFSTNSLMKWYLISMCFLLPSKIGFLDNEMEEMLSR